MDDGGIEGHECDGAAVGRGEAGDFCKKGWVGRSPFALDFDEQRDGSTDQRKQIGEGKDGRVGVAVAQARQVGGGEDVDEASAVNEPFEGFVVEDDRGTAGERAQVAFDAVTAANRRLKGGTGVFNPPRRHVVKSTMGDGAEEGIFIKYWAVEHYATMNRASISVAELRGSETAPTAARLWTPGAPKTAAMRSEAPLMTLGWSV